MFSQFKLAIQGRLAQLTKNRTHLFLTGVDSDLLWETYLETYPIEERQGHNCNACRSFIKHYGNLVAIENNQLLSIWDVEVPAPFDIVAKKLMDLVMSSGINDVFVPEFQKLGIDQNRQLLESGDIKTWQHFYFQLPKSWVTQNTSSIDAQKAEYRDTRNVFFLSLTEISPEAVETVLELITQNSIYRGEEFRSAVENLKLLQLKFVDLTDKQKENYCWTASVQYGKFLRIRNTAIGTLLTDISEGKDLDVAVSAFENIMAPSNYKRPAAIISKKMIEEAEKEIEALGLKSSLGRRYAQPEDITVDNTLFVNRSIKKTSGVFDQLRDSVTVNPKSFSKVEEVSVQLFIESILPRAEAIDVLLENRHQYRLVTLLAPQDAEAPGLFKWNNGFSWCYADALADGMKERVKAAGGNVNGVLRFSIQWNEKGDSVCDLDAHAYEPGGYHIYYQNARVKSAMSGVLDVDIRTPNGVAVENIVWTDLAKMKKGVYGFSIHNFDGRRNTGFSAQIEVDGQIYEFHSDKHLTGTTNIANVNFSANGFEVKPLMESSSRVQSKKLWNLDSYQFLPVTMVLRSPNHWDGQAIGNQHLFFMLDGAVNPQSPRGFFNEFLRDDLLVHKRVFEALGSKMQVAPADGQLSGLGFSSTSKEELIVKVSGSFTRTLKIKF